MPSNIYPPAIIKSEITRTGAVGPPGPNEVTDETDTNLTGPLFGDGSKVRVATPEEVVSKAQVSALLQAALEPYALAFDSFSAFLAGPSADVVSLRDEVYTVPDDTTVDAELRGETRQFVGGLFVRDDTATVDNGIVIQNTAGAKYVRQWDGVNIVPEFFRIGRGSLRNDTDAITAAATKLTKGGTLRLQNKKTYWGKLITVPPGTKMIGGTIKRIQLAQTTLAAQANAGATTITVADASTFRVGMTIQIATGLGYQDTSTRDSAGFIVNNINGNVITLSRATLYTMTSGASVFEYCLQFACSETTPSLNDADVLCEHVTFDGNNTQNNATHSWTLNNCAMVSGYLQSIRFNKCRFIDMPSDVVTVAGKAWFTECEWRDVYGACVHGSSGTDAGAEGVWIENCVANNVCISSATENGHGTYVGFYTQSARTRDIRVQNCRLTDLNLGYVFSHQHPGMYLTDSRVENARGIFADISRTEPDEAPKIIGNNFINAGNIITGGVGDIHLNTGLVISNNSFLNTSIRCVGNKDAVITANSFRWTSDYQTRVNAGEIDSIGANYGVLLSGEVQFSDNALVNEAPNSSALTHGVFVLAYTGFQPKFNADNNRIEGFSIGIETSQGLVTAPTPTAFAMRGNLIVIPTMSGTRRGILSRISGAQIVGNTVIATSAADAIGIYAQGVDTITNPALVAGPVIGNTVLGCATWCQTAWFDNIITNNVYEGVYNNISSPLQRIGANTKIETVGGVRQGLTEIGGRVLAQNDIVMRKTGGAQIYLGDGDFSGSFELASPGLGPVVGGLGARGNLGMYVYTGSSTRTLGAELKHNLTFNPKGGIELASLTDAAAPNSTLYMSTTQGKPVWKDASGVVNPIY
jgi:hypothetical protein